MSVLNNPNIKAKAAEKLIVLSRTHSITGDDAEHPGWAFLKQEYESPEVESTVDRLAISLVNACLTQRRIVFCLTRDDTQVLLRDDRNWKIARGFKAANWPKLKKELFDRGIIRELRPGKGRAPGIYELMVPEVLRLIEASRKDQAEEAAAFVEKMHGNEKGNGDLNLEPDIDQYSSKRGIDSRERARGRLQDGKSSWVRQAHSKVITVSSLNDWISAWDKARTNRQPTPEERKNLLIQVIDGAFRTGSDPDEVYAAQKTIIDLFISPSVTPAMRAKLERVIEKDFLKTYTDAVLCHFETSLGKALAAESPNRSFIKENEDLDYGSRLFLDMMNECDGDIEKLR